MIPVPEVRLGNKEDVQKEIRPWNSPEMTRTLILGLKGRALLEANSACKGPEVLAHRFCVSKFRMAEGRVQEEAAGSQQSGSHKAPKPSIGVWAWPYR